MEEIIKLIKNSKKTLFILCGLPYSGKTYFSDRVNKEIDIEYVSIDNIFHEFGYDWNLNKLPNENIWSEIFEKSYEQVSDALSKSRNVLYDSTNHTRVSRDVLRELAKKVDADTNIIFIDTPIKIIYNRWEENKLNKNRSIINKELLDETINAFERPMKDEKFISLDLI